MRHVLLCLALFSATPALAQPAPPPPAHGPHGRQPALFSISGQGTAYAAPDIAVLTSGVVTEANTAREALDANTAAMEKLLASLKSSGLEERDIATSGFSVQPRYVYAQKPDGTQEAPRITGYEVRNTVTVKVRDLAKLGGILDRVVTEGSNQIDGLAFDIADKKSVLDEARRKAFEDARAKAELFAQAAGVKLGRVRELTDNVVAPPMPPRPQMMRAEMAKSADVPVARGEQEIEAGVNVIWEIAP
ncbi:SIMPL domain-containing protein [Terrihabitans rhizophilus]|uniref:SIMPL domain-containing protein n=1 Tax=Terrihabitans rhizophilus TaxID=3092662 RepID=A0ABU4RPW3_9HYPH|nr:SIMPL domain-containing protein [Terrihabitans sp. PJ23]MDX6805680.1 SIMPL domain-containing protein [Terrihabitans sp. PJ23]